MISTDLLTQIQLANPWLTDSKQSILEASKDFLARQQAAKLLAPTWDHYISILTGPRQSGKTTLGRFVCQSLIEKKRFPTMLYLNCDDFLVREWLTGSHIISDVKKLLGTDTFILFIDEIQRLKTPGLILKSIHDLNLPIKLIATGSSQLELKSKVQEYLTGRHLETIVLPFSMSELSDRYDANTHLVYGSYPQIVTEENKTDLLHLLFQNYINKDVIEILKVRNADIMQRLITLIAHSSGQLINYQQLATDCKTSSHTIQHYLTILKSTYVLDSIPPFIGNKRQEITSNPVYYFLDNGFRNQALNCFLPPENRPDLGLLIEGTVFQELVKLKFQHYKNVNFHYWRTKGGAEVDFVLTLDNDRLLPIEVKYRTLRKGTVSRGFRSFLKAYTPSTGLIITKELHGEAMIEGCQVHFIPFTSLQKALQQVLDLM